MPDLSTVEEVLAEMKALGVGLRVPQVRLLARRVGRNRQQLAEQLWDTGMQDARILATFVADPNTIAPETMDKWAEEANCWGICDSCAYLFDRTPHAWKKIRQWAADDREFVRRAAFATIAAIAIHDKAAPDKVFLPALRLIEKYAFDDRNFARKGINWALRNIGKRNPALREAAIACAERVRDQNTRASRWIAADALRELRRRTSSS